MKVSVIGACGGIGQPLSALLVMSLPADAQLALYDVSPVIHGVACDLSHIPSPVIIQSYGREQLADALHAADIVLVPAGLPRKPGMTRHDLMAANAGIAAHVAREAAHCCPAALLGLITNPVNALVPLVARMLREAGVYDRNRLFGVTTLDVLRANAFLCERKHLPLTRPWGSVSVPVIGGHSAETILPLFSQSGVELSLHEVQELTERVRNAGTEVVQAKAGAGSATLSMAVAAQRCCLSMVQALQGARDVVECLYVDDGEYAPFFARPVALGPDGIAERLPLPRLSAFEDEALHALLPILQEEIAQGEGLAL